MHLVDWIRNRPHSRRRSLSRRRQTSCLELLEDRALLATFTVSNTDDSGAASLRAAIEASNATPEDDDRIVFQIPGNGPHIIALQSGLPDIRDTVFIDGTSHPSYVDSPRVYIDGTNAGDAHGLSILAPNSIVQGLGIKNFQRNGLHINSVNNVQLFGNHIGLDVDGFSDAGNGAHGIYLDSASLQGDNPVLMFQVDTSASVSAQFSGTPVGDVNNDGLSNTIMDASIAGLTAAVESLIRQGSGNSVAIGVDNFDMDLVTPGVQLTTFPSSDTNNNGVSDVIDILRRLNTTVDGIRYDPFHPDLREAVDFFTTLNVPSGDGNLVVVSDGRIGVDQTALAQLNALNVRRRGIAVGSRSNLRTMQIIDPDAVQVESTDELRDAALSIVSGATGVANMIVGGTGINEPNVIAYNGRAGIRVEAADAISNTFSGNSIFANGDLGIDIGEAGITLNDFDDSDSGTNQLTNYPWITSVVELNGQTFVRGIIQAIPNSSYSVELFQSDTMDGSGFGEGQEFLTSLIARTDAGGTGAFRFTIPRLIGNDVVSATATDLASNTSEFSRARPVDPSDPFADAVIAYVPQDTSRVIYFNDQNTDVSLGDSMPAEPFANLTTSAALANAIDAPSPRAQEEHNQQTHIWISGGNLELDFDFGSEFRLTTLHFWNYFEETFDVDSIELRFFDETRNPVGETLQFSPRLGGNGSNPISAEDFDLSLDAAVRYANVVLTGSNGEIDFNNIGFSAIDEDSGVPTHPNFTSPEAALEAPDYPEGGGLRLPGSVALGSGGLLSVEFVDNRLLNTGDRQFDLQIYEADPEAESTRIAVRPTPATRALLANFPDPDGDGFLDVGFVGGGLSYIDLDSVFPDFEAGELVFDAVQLIDDPNQGSTTGDTVGADIDAVVALEFSSVDGDFLVGQSGINTAVSESGQTDTILVVLTGEPESTVVLDVTPDTSGQISLDRPQLTFSPADWNIPQTVTISAVDDLRDDGDQVAFVTVSISSQTTDARFATRLPKQIPVLVADNDSRGINISKTQALVSESGTTDSFIISLASEPSSDVVLTIASSNTDEVTTSASELTFTRFDWNIPQTIELNGIDDVNTDGDQQVFVTIAVQDDASDNQYDSVADRQVAVTNADDDVPGLVVVQSDGTTASRESGSPDSFTIRLTTQPIDNVRVFVTSLDETNAIVSSSVVLITPAIWDTGVAVDVIAVDDVFVDGTNASQIRLAIDDENSDDFYDSVADQTFTVETTDDDEPGFILSSQSATVSETGSVDLSAILTSAPLNDVVISISSSDSGEAVVFPTQLTLTPENWGDPHFFTVSGVRDFVVDGTNSLQLTFTVDDENSDSEFAPLAAQKIGVEVSDSDVPGFRYSHIGGNTTISENGASDSFTVELTAQPESDVVIGILAADGTEMSISRRRLTFTPGNWNIPQTVTVTGVDDFIIDGDILATVTLSVEGHSSSTSFAAVPDQIVTIRNLDDDHPGLILSQSTAQVDESGLSDLVFVSLASQPRSNVVFNVMSSDTGEVNVSTDTISFLPGNWNIPRAVQLVPFSDGINDGDQTSSVTFTVIPQASDDDFDSLGPRIITVTTKDDDLPRIVGPIGTILDQRPTISITNIANADSYEIWMERIGGNSNPIANPTITGTTFELPTNLAGGRYRTWVRGNLSNGSRTSWDQAVFTVTIRPELQPLPAEASELRPTLNWNPVAGATSYRVYANNITSGNTGVVDEIVTTTGFTTNVDLGLGRNRFWVQAIGDGFQAWSTGQDYYLGSRPSTSIASTFEVRPTLEWSSVPNTASVRLYVTGPSGVVLDASGLTGNSYEIPFDLDPGRHRWWILPTHTSGRRAEWSPVSEIYVGGQPQLLAPLGDDVSGTPTFQWTPINNVGGYEIYLFNTDTRTIVHRETGINEAHWTAFPIPDGNYQFWVRSFDNQGNPALWSRVKHLQVSAVTAGITTNAVGPIGPTFDRTPTFVWEADSIASHYDLRIWNESESIVQEGLTSASWSPTSTLTAGPWNWAVRSHTGSGVGPWAFAKTDTSGRPELISPTGMTSSSQPLFQWTSVTGAARYFLFVDNLTTGESGVISNDQITSTTFTPPALAAATYRVWVRAISGTSGPPSPWSIVQEFTVVAQNDEILERETWIAERLAELSSPQEPPLLQTAKAIANREQPSRSEIQRSKPTESPDLKVLDRFMQEAQYWHKLLDETTTVGVDS